MKKIGFTLAEVLIVIAILGTIATLTMPTLMTNLNEHIWLNQFKSTYAVISNAYPLAVNDHGLPEDWDLSGTDKEMREQAANILFQYIRADQRHGFTNKFEDITYTDLPVGKALDVRLFDDNVYSATLANGALIAINDVGFIGQGDNYPEAKQYLIGLTVDLNGRKGPNVIGKDLFFLYLNSKKNSPVVTGYPLWWVTQEHCNSKTPSRDWHSGGACATWIIKNGNMDYLKREITADEWIQ